MRCILLGLLVLLLLILLILPLHCGAKNCNPFIFTITFYFDNFWRKDT